MGSEAASSDTPILDLIQPIPSGKRSRHARATGFILVFVGSPLGIFIGQATEDWQNNPLLLALPVLLVVVTVHEFGHAIAAQLVGFHLQGMSIGPVSVSNELGRWKVRLRRLHGLLGMTTLSLDRVRRVRHRFAWILLAGPLANLITALAAFLLDRFFQIKESALLHETLLTFAFLSLCIGIVNLFPFHGQGFNSDGRSLEALLCSPEEARRLISLLALNWSIRRVPIKRWNQRWIRAAVALADHSLGHLHASWYAYLSANARKEEQLAAQHLERCLSLAGIGGPQMRELLILEAAVFTAWFRRDAEKAKTWMIRVNKKQRLTKILELRARIAMDCVDNRFDEAVSKLNEGLAYFQSLPATAHRQLLETSWHEWLTEIEERRTPKALSTVASG
jgi:hypothetical protein